MGMRLWTHDLYFDKFEIFQPNPLCVFFQPAYAGIAFNRQIVKKRRPPSIAYSVSYYLGLPSLPR